MLAAAAVVVPSAAAAPRADLALVPLQSAQLGAAARTLPLEHDSGVVSNSSAASNAYGAVTAQKLARLGRVTGYQLDYGNPFLPGAGVHDVQTGVERYRSRAAAKRGLAFWRSDEVKAAGLAQLGVSATLTSLRVPAVGASRWAYAITLTVPNASPIYLLDEDVQDGNYVLAVTVAAGTSGAARQLAPKLATKVDGRLRAMLAGRLRGKQPKLPPKLAAGPPSTGPDPAKAALAASDFGQATPSFAKYETNEAALSEYEVAFAPAGVYTDVLQQILAVSTPGEATYFAAVLDGSMGNLAGSGASVTPVT